MRVEFTMNFFVAGLALLGFLADPPVDAQTVADIFRSYSSEYKDVQFLYEGTISPVDKNVPPVSFQGSYTYRSDGATLIDLFYLGGGRPTTRLLSSLLRNQQEDLEASPDYLPPLRDREPRISASGSGALDRPDTPERFFLASFFRGHVNVEEYGLEPQGWEEIDGHRCLVVRSYLGRRPQPNAPAHPVLSQALARLGTRWAPFADRSIRRRQDRHSNLRHAGEAGQAVGSPDLVPLRGPNLGLWHVVR